MNIILFGFPGCGKTYFGKILSRALQRPFIDTDDLVIEMDGRGLSVREIYQLHGGETFRALETKAIQQLKAETKVVIAVGGGAVLDPSNVTHLQKIGSLIYLKASFEVCEERILKRGTPSFTTVANLPKLYQERVLIYESIPARQMNVELLKELPKNTYSNKKFQSILGLFGAEFLTLL